MTFAVSELSKCAIDLGDQARPHIDAVRAFALPHTIKSGAVARGHFVLDLGEVMRVGGILVSNKPYAKARKGNGYVMAGSNDYQVFVRGAEGPWMMVHAGWLRPGGAKPWLEWVKDLFFSTPTRSQYVSFRGEWCRYIKFKTVSEYKGGAGLTLCVRAGSRRASVDMCGGIPGRGRSGLRVAFCLVCLVVCVYANVCVCVRDGVPVCLCADLYSCRRDACR